MTKKDGNRAAVARYQRTAKGRAVSRRSVDRQYQARRAFFRWLKAVPCMDCGVTFPPCVMDFDHREDEKKEFCVSMKWNCSAHKLQGELIKCDVVCSNCHRIRTAMRRGGL
jgi:hypothetical protein